MKMWKFYSVLVLFGVVVVKNVHSLQCWSCSSDLDRDCSDRFNLTLDYRYRSGGGGPYYQAQQGYNPNPPYNNRDYNNRDYNRDREYNRDRDYNRDQGRNYDSQARYDPQANRDRDLNAQDRDRNYDSQRRNLDSQGRPYDNNRPYDQSRPYDSNYPRDYNRPLTQDFGGPRLITCDDNEARLRRMRNVCLKKVQKIGYDSQTVIRRCEMIPMEKEIGTCYDAVARGITLDFCEYCEYDGCNSAHSAKVSMFLASLIPLAIFLLFNA